MPIKGITDRANQPLSRLGVLRKGGPKERKVGKNGQEYEGYGKELEHWRLDLDQPDQEIMDAWKGLGDSPKSLRVFFPYPTKEQNWSAWMEEYTAGGFVRRCDGTNQVQWRENGKVKTGAQKCLDGACKCSRTGRLAVMLACVQRYAYFTMETHSIHDLIHIESALRHYEAMFGSLAGVPFDLKRVPREISTPREGGNRVRITKHLVALEIDPHWFAQWLASQSAERQALLSAATPPALPELPESDYDPDLDCDTQDKANAQPKRDYSADLTWLDEVDFDKLTNGKLDEAKTRLKTLAQELGVTLDGVTVIGEARKRVRTAITRQVATEQ